MRRPQRLIHVVQRRGCFVQRKVRQKTEIKLAKKTFRCCYAIQGKSSSSCYTAFNEKKMTDMVYGFLVGQKLRRSSYAPLLKNHHKVTQFFGKTTLEKIKVLIFKII
jgi:hypothetical protein